MRGALSEDHLELPRVGLRAGELAGQAGRLDVGEPHDPALDLRDRLLRDHDHVVSLSPPACRADSWSARARSSPSRNAGIPSSGTIEIAPVDVTLC